MTNNTFNRLCALINNTIETRNALDIWPSSLIGQVSSEPEEWQAILLEIEFEFEVAMSESEFDDVNTIGELVDLIDAKLTAREAA